MSRVTVPGPMHVSVVIPTYNRARLLQRTVAALADQETGGATYDVTYVSNGSTDGTEKALQEIVARYPGRFRYFQIAPTGGPAGPRNAGIRAATGDVVLLLDDDIVPEPDLVGRHAAFHLAHPEPHHVVMGEVYIPSDQLEDPMSLIHDFPYHEVRNQERLDYLHFWTCNVSFKRTFMLENGMFDESFLYYEDVLCGHRLARSGMHLHFLPSARGQHLNQMDPKDLPAKGRMIGRWLHPFVERVPERAVKERFGILSPDLGAPLLARRLLKRLAFRIVDNPFTHVALRALGATNGKRSRVSDLYYFLIFRRNLLAGYYEARAAARAR